MRDDNRWLMENSCRQLAKAIKDIKLEVRGVLHFRFEAEKQNVLASNLYPKTVGSATVPTSDGSHSGLPYWQLVSDRWLPF